MKTYTIGFTQKSAAQFFGLLSAASVETVIDVRLHNLSQLAGYAKKDDLKYFLKQLCNASYIHLPELAPTKAMLDAYKKKRMSWHDYEDAFLDLMVQRNIETAVSPDIFANACLLCSEHHPHQCHRRLVVEYLNNHWNTALQIKHLY
ncbi:MAG: DUF488 domain-containing protein [Porticoccaceae bacterium]